jgi:Haem-binding uptake, Tiki superfamily, ChaN/TAT (twin-arginine translocation) pathway signal sequence
MEPAAFASPVLPKASLERRMRQPLRCSASSEPNLSRRDVLRAAALAAAAAGLPAQAQPAEVRWPAAHGSLAARTVSEAALRRSILYEKASGSLLPVSALPNVLKKMEEDVPILIGETHNQVSSHAAQLAALETLHAESTRPLVVGFEMLYRQHNPILDAYIDGAISLDTMLNRVNFERCWGFK